MSLLLSSHFVRDLARLLAGWLAAVVLVQAMASALGLAQGPRHLHLRADRAPAVFVHEDLAHAAEHREHGGWARHVHHAPRADDPTLHDDAQELGAAASLVLAAMVGLGPPREALLADGRGHVMQASPAWSCITHAVPMPDRPPRA